MSRPTMAPHASPHSTTLASPHRTTRTAALVAAAALSLAGLGVTVSGPADAAAHSSTGDLTQHVAARTATSMRYAAKVVTLVNQARGHARSCGDEHFAAVPKAHRDHDLSHAAASFARQMGVGKFFDHVAPNGTDPGDRITRAGYRWRAYGENIAAGYRTPGQVVRGWLESPGHCANIMTAFRDIGVGYADVPGSPYLTYWVIDFGTKG